MIDANELAAIRRMAVDDREGMSPGTSARVLDMVKDLVATIENERGRGTPPADDWTWDAASWEWSRVDGAADEEHEPTDLHVRHAAYWWAEEGEIADGDVWTWEVVAQIGQGDSGDVIASGSSTTARRGMEAADAALLAHLAPEP